MQIKPNASSFSALIGSLNPFITTSRQQDESDASKCAASSGRNVLPHLGRLVETHHKLLIVQEFILIGLGAGEEELSLRLGVVFVALHGPVEVPLGDDTWRFISKASHHQPSRMGKPFHKQNDANKVLERICLFRRGRTP